VDYSALTDTSSKGKWGAHLKEKRGPGRPKGSGLGVYSCNRSLVEVDKRSREYRLMRQTRKDLTAHIGGYPNAAQKMLIERAVILNLRVAMLDRKIVSGEILTTMDNHQYLAWSNSLVRTLRALGLAPASASAPSLNDIVAEIASRRAQPDAGPDAA
jgi:hypothetical protein